MHNNNEKDVLRTTEQAVRLLWDLKQSFDRRRPEGVKPLDFDRLLRDESYRWAVVSRLTAKNYGALTKQARRIKTMQLVGSVHINDVKKRLEKGVDASQIKERDDVWQARLREVEALLTRRMLRLKALSVTLSVFFSISLAAHLWEPIESLFRTQVVVLDGPIQQDTTFYSSTRYILNRAIFVEGTASLTIEPGTVINGRPGSALIITRDATIDARGTRDKPIVFTSSEPEGSRAPGDWGGLVLLGNAPVNRVGQLEGIPASDGRGEFGGSDKGSYCGTLEYVRVEFSGYETFTDNELNGLTLGGCGSDTVVRHVQVHKSLDDGVEVFGGTINLSHVVVSAPGDDGFDWDMGWTGTVQFLVVQMAPDVGDSAFEGDNNDEDPNALPRSYPKFFNVTLIGGNTLQSAHRAMTIRRGSAGYFQNFILAGFSKETVDLRGDVAPLIAGGTLDFTEFLFAETLGLPYFQTEVGDLDDDFGFNEYGYFTQQGKGVRFVADPNLSEQVFSLTDPEFAPQVYSPARSSSRPIPESEFLDEGANYLGALRPGAATNWLAGWSLFPSS